MVKKINCFKTLIGCFLIILQASVSWCDGDLSPSLVRIISGATYLCTGTLVKDRYVVTSAGCLKDQRNATAIIVEGYNEGRIGVFEDVARGAELFIPEDYDEETGIMDLAVIKLSKSIVGRGIQSAKLCDLESIPFDGPVTASAWILYRPRALRVESYNLTMINRLTCYLKYEISYSGFERCATVDEKRPCFRDTGFPAIIQGQFCGVFRSVPACTTDDLSSYIFTSLAVPKVRQFINKAISAEKA